MPKMEKIIQLVAGIDEVGRGPLAGPVTAAVVILDPKKAIKGLDDSKVIPKKRREELFNEIADSALAWQVGWASVDEIDSINILQASLLAMQRAVAALAINPDLILIDGRQKPSLPYPTQTLMRGDKFIAQISAASIMAKVSRDNLMSELDQQYPGYGFLHNQGYGTEFHLQQLQALGASPVHRKSFEPVRVVIEKTKK